MNFEVRDGLAVLLQDNMTAIKLASVWVDSPEKLVVFTRKYGETGHGLTPDNRVTVALKSAEMLWAECYAAEK